MLCQQYVKNNRLYLVLLRYKAFFVLIFSSVGIAHGTAMLKAIVISTFAQ